MKKEQCEKEYSKEMRWLLAMQISLSSQYVWIGLKQQTCVLSPRIKIENQSREIDYSETYFGRQILCRT